jgi:hypothetical protein
MPHAQKIGTVRPRAPSFVYSSSLPATRWTFSQERWSRCYRRSRQDLKQSFEISRLIKVSREMTKMIRGPDWERKMVLFLL